MELFLTLDRSRRTPLAIQIAHGVRDVIFSQGLPPGTKLPPTRELARQLQVSRTTVIEAYEWLISEGYAEARQGSGTYLGDALALSPGSRPRNKEPRRRTDVPADQSLLFDFRPGLPALELFPRSQWKASLSRAVLDAKADALGYGPVEGIPKLRQLIAEYLARTRGLPVAAERVVITLGAAQALDLILRTLSPIDSFAFEEPSAEPIHRLARLHQIPSQGIPVDENGLSAHQLEQVKPAPTAVHVIPSHQYPSGVVMSLERRLSLLAWAERHNALILEDDYDSEFRYDQAPPIALAALDTNERVIYIGSFSKTMFPALRMGFCILPERLIDRFLALKWFSDRCIPVVEQLALVEWLESGLFERHVRRMRKIYAKRRLTVIDRLQREFGNQLNLLGVPAGMHIMMQVSTGLSESEILEKALRHGIKVYPASSCYWGKTPEKPAIVLGFGGLSEGQIETGLKLLAEAIMDTS